MPRYQKCPTSFIFASPLRTLPVTDHSDATYIMAPASLLDLVAALPSEEGWGPPVSTETTLDGVPYAPYSKADKLGRMADWTEGKDRDARRQQYGNRGYRGTHVQIRNFTLSMLTSYQISKYMAQASKATHLRFKQQRKRLRSHWWITLEQPLSEALVEVVRRHSEDEVSAVAYNSNVVDAPLTKESDKGEEGTTRTIVAAETSEAGEEEDTETISHSAIATHQYKLSRTGICSRRLILLAWRS
jgi:hypothetical protein